MISIDRFVDPPREYSPVPFWFLNEKLDSQRLEWQLAEMHDQHVYGAVMHARPGLVDEYLSEAWFEHIDTIVRAARSLGMFTWIYDEYPWMSGMAEWRVPKLHDDFRIRALDRIVREVDGPGVVTWNFGEELPEDAGAIVSTVVAAVYPDGTTAPGREVASMEGRLEAAVGPSTHRLTVFFERYSFSPYVGPHGREAVTDLMHPAAVRAFISLTHEEYERRFGEYLGSTIRAVFTDEPPANTPGWSRDFLSEFERRKGYDLRAHLTLLFEQDTRLARQVRFDYGDVASELYEESFFGQLETWADRVGMASTGHVLLEETLPLHARFMGDYFRSERRLHYPGIDYIFPGEIPAVTCKLVASVARLSGRERVMSECFALTGWDFHPSHMKWMTDWQIVNGVDLLVPHAFFYATSETEPIPEMRENLGFRWFDCPPSMFYQQPYWPFYRRYADYARRLCYLITRGRHRCSVAIYYPIETVQADYVPTREYCDLSLDRIPGTWMTADYLWDGTPMEQTDAHFRRLGNALRDLGIDYDVIDDDTIRASTVHNGSLVTTAGTAYRAVILPRTEMIGADVYRTIFEFYEGGGTLFATGCLPRLACEGPADDFAVDRLSRSIFGDRSDGARRAWFSDRPDDELFARLRELGVADFTVDEPGIYAQHRTDGEVELYFVVNHDRHARTRVSVWCRGDGRPVVLDPYDGTALEPSRWRRERDGVRIELAFDANESLFVAIGEHGTIPTAERVRLEPDSLGVVCEVSGPWSLRIEPGDTHPLRVSDMPASPRFDELPGEQTVDSLRRWEELGLADFSGEGVYETQITIDRSVDGEWYVDLGEVGVAAGLVVNGRSCGERLFAPYRFRVTEAVRRGENHLRVRTANTLANAIQATYGSEATETSAEPWQVNHFATFADGRLRSGLIGPVLVLRTDR